MGLCLSTFRSLSEGLRLLPILLALVASLPAWAETYTGRVVRITDGDTVVVLDESRVQHKVRLAGIDAPEKKQPFGNIAKQNLAALVFGKTVTVETSKLDRYRREIGKVVVGTTDANLEQIRAGLAWHYRQYDRELHREDRVAYSNAETLARQERRGLWRDANPVPPWDFRHRKANGTKGLLLVD
jgi:endonuclease YncB( thermonuclease family)